MWTLPLLVVSQLCAILALEKKTSNTSQRCFNNDHHLQQLSSVSRSQHTHPVSLKCFLLTWKSKTYFLFFTWNIMESKNLNANLSISDTLMTGIEDQIVVVKNVWKPLISIHMSDKIEIPNRECVVWIATSVFVLFSLLEYKDFHTYARGTTANITTRQYLILLLNINYIHYCNHTYQLSII